jgi:pimeloyl-ACP methyl ester carboxylesterase
LWEIHGFLDAPDYAEAATFRNVQAYDARKLGPEVGVPFFIFNGEKDNITPTSQAREYFNFVQAPHKAFVSFPGLGHSAVLTAPDLFLRSLIEKVRPVAIETEHGS